MSFLIRIVREPSARVWLPVLLLGANLTQAHLADAYYIGASGDTLKGKIEVHFLDDYPDSIHFYELQYSMYFVNDQKKVLLLTPNKLIKEVGIYHKNHLIKMICVNRKECLGWWKLRRRDQVFAVRKLHGPIEIYELFLKRWWGILDYESDLCFHRTKTKLKVRESTWLSERKFVEMVEDCKEAVDLYNRNGLITQSQSIDLIMEFNKYCGY